MSNATSIIEYVTISDMSPTISLYGNSVDEYTREASQIPAEVTKDIFASRNWSERFLWHNIAL